MMVVLFHLHVGSHLYALTRHGWAAVDFFFVLSGFVLMAGFAGRLTDANALGRYAVRRLARLYPLHLVTLVVLVALVGYGGLRDDVDPFTGGYSLTALAQCLTLTQGFTLNQLSWNFPSWSISLELWAGLLFGLTLWLFRARASIVFVLYVLGLATLLVILPEPQGTASTPAEALFIAAHYIFGFFVGALLFDLFARLVRGGVHPPRWAEWPAVGIMILCFLFADQIPAMAMIGLSAVVILIFAFEAGQVSVLLNRPAPQAAGAWSYSIYLTHPLWTVILTNAITSLAEYTGHAALKRDAWGERFVLGGPFAMDLLMLLCLALVLATSWLTYRLIEQPGRALAQLRAVRGLTSAGVAKEWRSGN